MERLSILSTFLFESSFCASASHLYKSNVQFNVTIKMSRLERAGIIPIDLYLHRVRLSQSFSVSLSALLQLRDVNRSPAATLDI